MSRVFTFVTAVVMCLFLLVPNGTRAAEKPLARIAVVSNPYITTLAAAEIKDEFGGLRDFLAKAGPDSMKKTVALVNELKPDAFVVLGSLTWSGSSEDFAAFAEYLDQIKAQGETDSPGRFAELLANEPWMHKRMKAMEIFSRSQVYADLTGFEVEVSRKSA